NKFCAVKYNLACLKYFALLVSKRYPSVILSRRKKEPSSKKRLDAISGVSKIPSFKASFEMLVTLACCNLDKSARVALNIWLPYTPLKKMFKSQFLYAKLLFQP